MIPDKVKTTLDAHGLAALEFEPGSTPTAETAAARIGVKVGQIAKSILLLGKDGKYRMLVLAGDRKLSSSKAKRLFGVKLSMATAEQTYLATGFKPGGVCPFGLDGLPIFIDRSLEQYQTVYPAAGTDASGVPVSFEKLLAMTGGGICDLAE